MSAAALDYKRPEGLGQALEFLAADGSVALAGATDLITLHAAGAVSVRILVDIKRLPELHTFEEAGNTVRLGAAVPLARVAELARHSAEALADGAALVGAPQTRARGTVGGNVCRSSPAGDTLPPLLVLGARAVLRSVRGERTVPLAEFFVGPGTNAARADELLVALELEQVSGGSAYRRFTYRAWMDLAVVGVAARVELDGDGCCIGADVAIGAVAATPRLVPRAALSLVGSEGDLEAIEEASLAVVSAACPIDDVRGSARYRLRVLRPLARETIRLAFERGRRAALASRIVR